MALLCPLLPTALFPVSHTMTYLLTQCVNNTDRASNIRFVPFSSFVVLNTCVFSLYMFVMQRVADGVHQSHSFKLQC